MQNIGTIVAIILIVALLVILFGSVGMMGWGGFGMGGMMGNMGGMMGNFGGFFSPLGAILMLVFWALIIAGGVLLVVWLVRSLTGPSPTSTATTGLSPLDILKMRYAKGEITKEQFEEMKRDLGE